MTEIPETLGVPRTKDRELLAFCAGHLYRDRYMANPEDRLAGLKFIILLGRHSYGGEVSVEMARQWCGDLLSSIESASFDQAWSECCQLMSTGFAADIEGWGPLPAERAA